MDGDEGRERRYDVKAETEEIESSRPSLNNNSRGGPRNHSLSGYW